MCLYSLLLGRQVAVSMKAACMLAQAHTAARLLTAYLLLRHLRRAAYCLAQEQQALLLQRDRLGSLGSSCKSSLVQLQSRHQIARRQLIRSTQPVSDPRSNSLPCSRQSSTKARDSSKGVASASKLPRSCEQIQQHLALCQTRYRRHKRVTVLNDAMVQTWVRTASSLQNT